MSPLFLRSALALFLLAMAAAPAAAITISADAASNPKTLWKAVMTEAYGPYDAGRKCWIGKSGGNEYCMRPHKLDAVDGGARLFIAVASAQGSADSCHGCGGYLGLLVFDRQPDGSYRLAARNSLFDGAGSWGEVPPEEAFKLTRIGAQAFAWVVELGFTAQGHTGISQIIYVPVGSEVVDFGFIPTHHDDCGANDVCGSYTYGLRFEPGTGKEYFDAIAELASGSDVPKIERRFVIPFDAATRKYVAPEAYTSVMAM